MACYVQQLWQLTAHLPTRVSCLSVPRPAATDVGSHGLDVPCLCSSASLFASAHSRAEIRPPPAFRLASRSSPRLPPLRRRRKRPLPVCKLGELGLRQVRLGAERQGRGSPRHLIGRHVEKLCGHHRVFSAAQQLLVLVENLGAREWRLRGRRCRLLPLSPAAADAAPDAGLLQGAGGGTREGAQATARGSSPHEAPRALPTAVRVRLASL